MPILLKNKTKNEPGIISFTHGEALFGVPAKFKNVSNFLTKKSKKKEWIFGVHIQGDLSWIGKWLKTDWQDFFMWSNIKDQFLTNIPPNKITNLTCINFFEKNILDYVSSEKEYDLCCVTRFSSLKRTKFTFQIFKNILKKNSKCRILFISPIASNFKNDYENEVIQSVRKIFNPKELDQIDFICNSQEYFGNFPLSDNLIYKLISSSSNLMLNSHQEGVPRVIIEALILNCKVIVSKKLKSGINNLLNSNNSLIYEDNDNPFDVANEIENFIKVNKNKNNNNLINKNEFLAENNVSKFKEFIRQICRNKGINKNFSDDFWFLDNLIKRLPCHNNLVNYTLMNNDKAFFKWFSEIQKITSIEDEVNIYANIAELDKKKKYFSNLPYYFHFFLDKIRNKIFKAND